MTTFARTLKPTAFAATLFAPASLAWFARHELTLAWRRWLSILAGGRRRKTISVLTGLTIVVLALHGLAFAVLKPVLSDFTLSTATLVSLTGTLLLSFSMMLSQTLESVTRAFYTRDDFDLILSSPASAKRVFAVRMGAVAFSAAAMTSLLAAPAINTAAFLDGAHWLWAYTVVIAMAGIATALAILTTLGLFRAIGARRTRLIAQIIAAIVGAAFLIGIQVVAILSLGEVSRFALFQSDMLMGNAPAINSLFWLPAKAALGHGTAAAAIVIFSGITLCYVIWSCANQFSVHVLAAASTAQKRAQQQKQRATFHISSQRQALRRKEWALLARDPWLVSQSLMQVLYLIPPALILWMNHAGSTEIQAIVGPVLVMAIGQLSGGLAWLAVSGEDAPDLIQTAPISRSTATLAKIEAILIVIAVTISPFILALSFWSLQGAFVTACGVGVASLSAIAIQLWFQTQSKRSTFRRRQTASRTATFSEAFVSIFWAATTGLAAAGSMFAVATAFFALVVLFTAWSLSGKGKSN